MQHKASEESQPMTYAPHPRPLPSGQSQVAGCGPMGCCVFGGMCNAGKERECSSCCLIIVCDNTFHCPLPYHGPWTLQQSAGSWSEPSLEHLGVHISEGRDLCRPVISSRIEWACLALSSPWTNTGFERAFLLTDVNVTGHLLQSVYSLQFA